MNNRLKQASIKVGGLSSPSKMPCYGYSIPASRCITGSKLRKVKGSVCSSCYACKGRYLFSNVQNALERRYESMNDLKGWTQNMVDAIYLTGDKYFRWHDSGDIQSIEHLQAIVNIAYALPGVMFWLPTKEHGIVGGYLDRGGVIPSNLTIRISAPMIEQRCHFRGLPVSEVSSDALRVNCKAPSQQGKCQDCRMCWDSNVLTVVYKKH
jgi:hypothetical protein